MQSWESLKSKLAAKRSSKQSSKSKSTTKQPSKKAPPTTTTNKKPPSLQRNNSLDKFNSMRLKVSSMRQEKQGEKQQQQGESEKPTAEPAPKTISFGLVENNDGTNSKVKDESEGPTKARGMTRSTSLNRLKALQIQVGKMREEKGVDPNRPRPQTARPSSTKPSTTSTTPGSGGGQSKLSLAAKQLQDMKQKTADRRRQKEERRRRRQEQKAQMSDKVGRFMQVMQNLEPMLKKLEEDKQENMAKIRDLESENRELKKQMRITETRIRQILTKSIDKLATEASRTDTVQPSIEYIQKGLGMLTEHVENLAFELDTGSVTSAASYKLAMPSRRQPVVVISEPTPTVTDDTDQVDDAASSSSTVAATPPPPPPPPPMLASALPSSPNVTRPRAASRIGSRLVASPKNARRSMAISSRRMSVLMTTEAAKAAIEAGASSSGSGSGGGGGLLSQLKKTKLKKVDMEQVEKEKERSGADDIYSSLQDTISIALEIRKAALENESDSDEWSDEWSDE